MYNWSVVEEEKEKRKEKRDTKEIYKYVTRCRDTKSYFNDERWEWKSIKEYRSILSLAGADRIFRRKYSRILLERGKIGSHLFFFFFLDCSSQKLIHRFFVLLFPFFLSLRRMMRCRNRFRPIDSFFFFFFFKFLLGIYKSERIDRKIYGRNARNTRELSLLLLLRFRFEQSQVWSREKRYIFI